MSIVVVNLVQFTETLRKGDIVDR